MKTILPTTFDKINILYAHYKSTSMSINSKIYIKYGDCIQMFKNNVPGMDTEPLNFEKVFMGIYKCERDDLSDLAFFVNTSTASPNSGVKIYNNRDSNWELFDVDSGICEVVKSLYGEYWCEYERYMMVARKMANWCAKKEQAIMDSLLEYYAWLVAFGLEPYCIDKSDHDIFHNNQTSRYDECSFYIERFERVKKKMTGQAIKKYKQSLKSLVLLHSKRSFTPSIIENVQAILSGVTPPHDVEVHPRGCRKERV